MSNLEHEAFGRINGLYVRTRSCDQQAHHITVFELF